MPARGRIQLRQGYMKFLRLGSVKHAEQSRWSGRAPENKGMWAFPYPFYDSFFTYHKYKDLLPKKLRNPPELGEDFTDAEWEAAEKFYQDQQDWIKNVGRKVLKIHEFWYRGDVYSHFTPTGDIGNTYPFCEGGPDWALLSVQTLAKYIKSSGANKSLLRVSGGPLEMYWSSMDHLEIFIPEGRGKIRHRLTQDK